MNSNKTKISTYQKPRKKVTLMSCSSHAAVLVMGHFNKSQLKAMGTGHVPREDV